MYVIRCVNCKGITEIFILKDSQKRTEPKVEFCHFVECQFTQRKNKKLIKNII